MLGGFDLSPGLSPKRGEGSMLGRFDLSPGLSPKRGEVPMAGRFDLSPGLSPERGEVPMAGRLMSAREEGVGCGVRGTWELGPPSSVLRPSSALPLLKIGPPDCPEDCLEPVATNHFHSSCCAEGS